MACVSWGIISIIPELNTVIIIGLIHEKKKMIIYPFQEWLEQAVALGQSVSRTLQLFQIVIL